MRLAFRQIVFFGKFPAERLSAGNHSSFRQYDRLKLLLSGTILYAARQIGERSNRLFGIFIDLVQGCFKGLHERDQIDLNLVGEPKYASIVRRRRWWLWRWRRRFWRWRWWLWCWRRWWSDGNRNQTYDHNANH